MFVQDNLSVSVRGTLRGLHFQHPRAQGKLIMAAWGSVFDVVVDVRQDSSTFGRWVGLELSEENGRQVWIPPGFAHGFAVLSDTAMLLYKCTDYYAPEHEHTVRWNDPAIAVAWPLASPILSAKDAGAPLLGDLSPHQLPRCDVDAG
jgi:dTDP-4-dehydrorhamnose 3,5-epimerase